MLLQRKTMQWMKGCSAGMGMHRLGECSCILGSSTFENSKMVRERKELHGTLQRLNTNWAVVREQDFGQKALPSELCYGQDTSFRFEAR